jgi:hypothetical protein
MIAIKFDNTTDNKIFQLNSPEDTIKAVAPAGGWAMPSKTFAVIAVAVDNEIRRFR